MAQFSQRLLHHGEGAFKYPTAAAHEQGITTKQGPILCVVVGNVIQGVPRHFHDLESIPKNRDLSPFSHCLVDVRNFGVIGTNNPTSSSAFQRADTACVIKVMMGNDDGIEY